MSPAGGPGTVEIDTREIELGFEELTQAVGREAAGRWFSASQEHLAAATANRSGSGAADDSARDQRGSLIGRQTNNLHSILQSGQPPQWDEAREAWVFTYTHLASVWMEYGTRPHVIEPKHADWLAFEWPDAPDEIKERFEDTFPLVFFKRIDHPGAPAIGYVRAGRHACERWLKEQDRSGGSAIGGDRR